MTDEIQRLILEQLRAMDGKLDDCKDEIAQTRTAVASLETKVDERSRWTDRERDEVGRRLAAVEREQAAQGKLSAKLAAKVGVLATAIGAAAGWVAERLFPS